MTDVSAAFLSTRPPGPVTGVPANGAINGGLLRPGALDQSQFRRLLQAQSGAQQTANTRVSGGRMAGQPTLGQRPGLTLGDYRRLAGVPFPQSAPTANARPALAPPATPIQAPAGSGIPILTPAQFAALTGQPLPDVPQPSGSPTAGPATVPAVGQVAAAGQVPATSAPMELVPAASGRSGGAGDGIPVPDVAAAEAPVDAPAGGKPAPVGPEADPRVVWVDKVPDRDERRTLFTQGKHWALRETPGARELFLGPDGKFGWDDFIDIINPLQHIPIITQIYRAVTGDQAYGLSNFIGALPFGPISVAAAVIDTAIRSTTGHDAGTDLAARVLGLDNRTPEEANLNLVWDRQRQGGDLAAAAAAQVDGSGNVGTADMHAIDAGQIGSVYDARDAHGRDG